MDKNDKKTANRKCTLNLIFREIESKAELNEINRVYSKSGDISHVGIYFDKRE